MKIYYEIVFIINFLLDFMILFGTKRLLKINSNIYKLIIGSFIGSFTTFVLFINISSFFLFFTKVFISILMIIVSFGFKKFFRNLFYFYLISIIIGGVMYLFDLNNNVVFCYIFLLIGSPITICLFVFELSKYKEKYNNKYIVEIYYKNNVYKFEGFIDTGNRLKSPISHESVILINSLINANSFIYVPYKALNTTGIIPCFKPDKVIVDNIEFSNCLIGISKDKFNLDGEDCILPNKFKERLC